MKTLSPHCIALLDADRVLAHTGPTIPDMRASVVTDNAERLWAETTGHGPPVVFLHGGPGLWDYLAPLAGMLDDQNTVHRFDQRGCGRSTGADGPFTIAQAVKDLDAVRRHFGHDRWLLLGHSWGAELALHYAAAHPHRTIGIAYVGGVGAGSAFREPHRVEAARRRGPQRENRLLLLDSLTERSGSEERERCLLAWLPNFSPG